MTTLLTGGNGWVPSHILRRLARRGERVISYDIMDPDVLLYTFLGDAVENVVFVEGDVTDDARLREIAGAYDIDALIHAAAITPRIDREREEAARIIDVNLMAVVRCLEIARSTPSLRRMVNISSTAAWGGGHAGETLDEESPSHATGLYGICKHTGERFCRRYRELYGIDVVSVRPANVYGPMERLTLGYRGATELREMLRILAAGDTLKVNSLDGPYRDWTFVEDIAEGVERIWSAVTLPNDVYTITCGRQYAVGDMLAAFQRAWPDLRYELVDAEHANYLVSGDTPGPTPSNARLAEDLGWTPSTTLDEGVAIYLDWIKRHGPQ
jgi:nucleoside-diphosphate-sugar epimerase